MLNIQENPACMKESGGGATLIKVAPPGPEPKGNQLQNLEVN